VRWKRAKVLSGTQSKHAQLEYMASRQTMTHQQVKLPWQNRLTAVVKPCAEARPYNVRGQAGFEDASRRVEAAVCLQEGANYRADATTHGVAVQGHLILQLGVSSQQTQREAGMHAF
jgi:hypothetical protein